MDFTRKWSMPNLQTFTIKPIEEFIKRFLTDGVWIDPFVRDSIFKTKMKYTKQLQKVLRLKLKPLYLKVYLMMDLILDLLKFLREIVSEFLVDSIQ